MRTAREFLLELLVIAALAAGMLWLLPAEASAQNARPAQACVGIQVAAVAANLASVEVQAGGGGIVIEMIDFATANVAIRLSTATILDSAIAAVTPTFVAGHRPLTSVIRTGQDAGAVPADNAQWIPDNAFTFDARGLFVPAGKFLTIQRSAQNQVLNVALCFTELPGAPSFP